MKVVAAFLIVIPAIAFAYWFFGTSRSHPLDQSSFYAAVAQGRVEEVTIAGNLRDMFANLVAAGDDVDTRGNIHSGSVLIAKMMVAGA